MKQLLQSILLLSLLGGLSFAQRTFEDKENRSTTVVKPGLPYINIDGRQAAQGTSPYRGFSGTLKQRLAETRRPDITVLGRDEAGLPIFLQTEAAAAKNFPSAVEPAALLFLDDIAAIIGIDKPSDEFQVRAVEGNTVRLKQVWQGVPIWGADIAVNFMSDGQVVMSGRYRSSPVHMTMQPTVTDKEAVDEALEVVGKHTPVRYLRPIERKILQYPEHEANLMLYAGKETNNELRLVYHLDLRPNFMARWAVWVDAQTGKVVKEYDHTCTIGPVTGSSRDLKNVSQTFSVYDEGSNRFSLVDASQPMFNGATNPDLGDGIILTADMNNSTLNNPQFNDIISSSANAWNANAVSAHVNAIASYNYFRNTHSRNSINGAGGDVVSFINVADDDGGGLDNAFWNGRAIFYGSGRTVFQPLARGLDVASHEMSHGVVQETANLEYQDESGALNESFADVFGAMVDRDDWRIGEDVMRSGGGALRDMQDPHNGAPTGNFNAGWQPEKYSERYTGTQDNGGVHINSGIPNHAFYLFATANGVGKAKAELIFYEALSRYLTRSSRFVDLRLAVVKAAENRHGANSTEVNAAKAAFDQVEILDPNGGSGGGGSNPGPTPLPGNLNPNPGPDFIVSTDNNPADANTLYISSTTGTNFQAISQIPHKHRISVVDDGSLGCIVGDDGHIYLLNMNPANPQSQQLSIDPVWENAVLSKDGNRLAAVEVSVDTSIYVFNLAASPVTGARYRLYNPTNTQGVNFSGMLYADAMEFDYSGENLAFDAFNRIPNISGTDLTFWTIGFLKVWDNGANNFGDGNIELLINQLDPGESIGDPTFSKNSPYIMAFDYITDSPPAGQGSYYLLAMNIETDSIGAIWNQDKLFVPDYSRLDDKIIFDAVDGFDDVIEYVDLNADKISRATNPQALIPDAQWGVWFSTGQRSLEPTSVDEALSALPFSIYPNPAKDAITCQFDLEAASDVQLVLRDMTGREVRSLAPQKLGSGEQRLRFSLQGLPAGSYALRIRTDHVVVTRKIVVQ